MRAFLRLETNILFCGNPTSPPIPNGEIWRKDFTSSVQLPWKRGIRILVGKKQHSCLRKQHVQKCNTSFHEVQPPLFCCRKNLFCRIMLPVWFKFFIHIEGILHTYNHDLFLSKIYIHPGFYFIVMFLYMIAWFSIKWFSPLLRKPCTYSHQHFL